MSQYDILIRGGTLVSAEGRTVADLAIRASASPRSWSPARR